MKSKSSEEIYAEVTKWLIYVAYVAMALALTTRLIFAPEHAFHQLEQAIAGGLAVWRPEVSQDMWVVYAVGFANLIVAVGLSVAVPALIREHKATAAVAIFVLLLLLLTALAPGVVKIH